MKKLLITFFTIHFCLTSSVGWIIEYKELIKRDGLYYKKFTDVLFTREITSQQKGSLKNGLKDGSWVTYQKNGQLKSKGNYNNGKKDGTWFYYNEDGNIWEDTTGTYENRKKISE